MNKSHSVSPKTLLSIFLVSVFILSLLGVLFVFEASLVESLKRFNDQYFIIKQHLIGLGLGVFLFLLTFKIPPKVWLRLSPLIYLSSLVLLVLTFFPVVGVKLNGAHRWVNLGLIRFQPVEALKFSLVLFLSNELPKLKTTKEKLIKFLVYLGLPAIIIILQPDLGSLLLVGTVAALTYFIAGGKAKTLGLLGLAALPLVFLAIVLAPYRMQRLTTFLHPENDPLGASFHVRQIQLALGRGGWFGVGIGNSKQKYAYIPEAATDSIFAIVGEEVGFIGSVFIILLYMSFFISGFKLINQSQSSLEAKTAGFGFLIVIMTQAVFNLGAIVGLIPLTGMPLPFFSYGRSSQIMIWLALAFITSLALSQTKKKANSRLKKRSK